MKSLIAILSLFAVVVIASPAYSQGVPKKTTKQRNAQYNKKTFINAKEYDSTVDRTHVQNNPKHTRPGEVGTPTLPVVSEPATGFSMKSSKYHRKFSDRD